MKCKCGNEFEQTRSNQLYCSVNCRRTVNNEANKLAQKATRRLAPKRDISVRNMTVGDYLSRRSHKLSRSVRKDSFRYFANAWNKDLKGQPCRICGYSLHTELAHIKAVKDFPDTALLSEVHAKENLVPLCRNHHWEYDNGFIHL